MAEKNSESITPDLVSDLEQVTMNDEKVGEHNPFVEDPDIYRPSDENGDEIQSKKRTDTETNSPQNDFSEVENRVVRPKNKEKTAHDEELGDEDLPDERHLYEYFWRRHSVFSQQYNCQFTVDGTAYSSAEQYMMHQKAVLMGDQEIAEIIMALDEPQEIKQTGKKIQNFDAERWEEACQAIVERGNMEKFSQNEELKEKLFSTFPKTLVEASPLDDIWGIGVSRDDRRAWNKLSWKGQNLLGQILTKVRDKLMESFLQPVVPEETEGDPE